MSSSASPRAPCARRGDPRPGDEHLDRLPLRSLSHPAMEGDASLPLGADADGGDPGHLGRPVSRDLRSVPRRSAPAGQLRPVRRLHRAGSDHDGVAQPCLPEHRFLDHDREVRRKHRRRARGAALLPGDRAGLHARGGGAGLSRRRGDLSRLAACRRREGRASRLRPAHGLPRRFHLRSVRHHRGGMGGAVRRHLCLLDLHHRPPDVPGRCVLLDQGPAASLGLPRARQPSLLHDRRRAVRLPGRFGHPAESLAGHRLPLLPVRFRLLRPAAALRIQAQEIDVLTAADLVELHRKAFKPRERWTIGLEMEKMAVDARSGRPLPYDGAPASVRSVLVFLAAARPSEPLFEDSNLIALAGEWGTITLEPGGQVEWSSPPAQDLFTLERLLGEHIRILEQAAQTLGLRWLEVALQPDAPLSSMPWMPKRRYRIMREYFRSRGSLAHRMMTQTASIQVSLDYSDEADWREKFRAGFYLAPIAVAAFANSRRMEGRDSGYGSRSEEHASELPSPYDR